MAELKYTSKKRQNVLFTNADLCLLHFISEKFLVEKNHGNVSNQKTFKSLSDAVFGCLTQMGDSCIMLKLLCKNILNEMVYTHPSSIYSSHVSLLLAKKEYPHWCFLNPVLILCLLLMPFCPLNKK